MLRNGRTFEQNSGRHSSSKRRQFSERSFSSKRLIVVKEGLWVEGGLMGFLSEMRFEMFETLKYETREMKTPKPQTLHFHVIFSILKSFSFGPITSWHVGGVKYLSRMGVKVSFSLHEMNVLWEWFEKKIYTLVTLHAWFCTLGFTYWRN